MQNPMGLTARKVQLVVDQIDNLPTLPAVATRVLSLAASDDAGADELSQIIEADQSLASRILALVNSAGFGSPKSVTTVKRAVMLLGFEAVRSSVLSLKVFDLFNRRGVETFQTSFDRKGFWKHAVAVAVASHSLARRVRNVKADEAYIAGLLHDVGKVALDFALPKTYDQVARRVKAQRSSYVDAEAAILGVDHTAIGKRLFQNWEFPESLVNVAWLHHQNVEHLPGDIAGRRLVQVVNLADMLAREQRIGSSSPVHGPLNFNDLIDELGLSSAEVDGVARELHRLAADQVQVLGLDRADADGLHYQSLQQANAELGAINQRLLTMGRKLKRQQQHADILTRLNRHVGATRSTRGLLTAVAESMLEWLRPDHCAVYYYAESGGYVEGAVRSLGTERPEHFLFEVAESDMASILEPITPTESYGLVRAERTESWLFDRVGSLMGRGPFYSYPLLAGKRRLGGIVFGQPQELQVFGKAELQQMEALATSAALALGRQTEREELSRMMDQLADANRRAAEVQEELVRRRNLASVGEMAAGAAHEINNPLAVISGRAQILAETEPDESKRKALDVIAEQAERASRIIGDMMFFARPPASRRKPTDLVLLLRGLVADRQPELGEGGIELSAELPDDAPAVDVDGEQMRWAVGELVTNAAAACPSGGGRIAVRMTVDEESGQVIVSVVDSGTGMDHDTLGKAFDPFFCGQKAGRGRGLGLAKVQRLVEANGGQIELESGVGAGTSAHVTFGAAEAQAGQPAGA